MSVYNLLKVNSLVPVEPAKCQRHCFSSPNLRVSKKCNFIGIYGCTVVTVHAGHLVLCSTMTMIYNICICMYINDDGSIMYVLE